VNQDWRPAAAAAVSGVLVGAAIVATRAVVDRTGPVSLALLRYSIGGACLLPPVLISARVLPSLRDLAPIALLGIGQFGVLIVLLNLGLQRIPSAHAALIFASTPLLTMVLSAGLRRERLTSGKVAGVVLTIAGVGILFGDRFDSTTQSGDAWSGDLAVLGAALCGAVCSVLYGPYVRRYPALSVGLLAMCASVVFLAPLAALEGFRPRELISTLGGAEWLAIIFVGLASGVGYFCWLWALGHTTATRVTVFLALSPVTAAAFGAILLTEPISQLLLVGLACVVVGLWLAHIDRQGT
jgi:drug/metabolite transporter (DMT)-like permease